MDQPQNEKTNPKEMSFGAEQKPCTDEHLKLMSDEPLNERKEKETVSEHQKKEMSRETVDDTDSEKSFEELSLDMDCVVQHPIKEDKSTSISPEQFKKHIIFDAVNPSHITEIVSDNMIIISGNPFKVPMEKMIKAEQFFLREKFNDGPPPESRRLRIIKDVGTSTDPELAQIKEMEDKMKCLSFDKIHSTSFHCASSNEQESITSLGSSLDKSTSTVCDRQVQTPITMFETYEAIGCKTLGDMLRRKRL